MTSAREKATKYLTDHSACVYSDHQCPGEEFNHCACLEHVEAIITEARREAFEEAANICDLANALGNPLSNEYLNREISMAGFCAEKIRALAEKEKP